MDEEKEIKVRVKEDITLEALKEKLENTFDVQFDKPKKDKDIYFDSDEGHYFRMNQGLRLRNENLLTYKALFYIPKRTKNPWFVLEKEHKLPVSKEELKEVFNIANIKFDLVTDTIGKEKLKEILKKINLKEHMKINKTRYIAKNENYSLCLDKVDNLGLFVEIEAKADRYLETIRKKFPFKNEEIRHGYTSIYAKEIMDIDVPDFKKKFLSDPEWNYLEGQKEIIKESIEV